MRNSEKGSNKRNEVLMMGGRYWLSGVQLGMLLAFCTEKNWQQAIKLLKDIEDLQYIGDRDEIMKKFKLDLSLTEEGD
jgi:hypothetical protein